MNKRLPLVFVILLALLALSGCPWNTDKVNLKISLQPQDFEFVKPEPQTGKLLIEADSGLTGVTLRAEGEGGEWISFEQDKFGKIALEGREVSFTIKLEKGTIAGRGYNPKIIVDSEQARAEEEVHISVPLKRVMRMDVSPASLVGPGKYEGTITAWEESGYWTLKDLKLSATGKGAQWMEFEEEKIDEIGPVETKTVSFSIEIPKDKPVLHLRPEISIVPLKHALELSPFSDYARSLKARMMNAALTVEKGSLQGDLASLEEDISHLKAMKRDLIQEREQIANSDISKAKGMKSDIPLRATSMALLFALGGLISSLVFLNLVWREKFKGYVKGGERR